MIKNYTPSVLNAKTKAVCAFLLLFVLSFGAFSQVTYTFTNASATGSTGPSQAQVTAAYMATNLNGAVTATGGIQFWVVPVSGNYGIEAQGASGGGISAGLGAIMRGDVYLNAGDTLLILVGQMGIDALDGSTTAGGGSYVVWRNATSTIVTSNGRPVTPLVIAGGGGGNPGTANPACNGSTLTAGNAGNGATGSGIGGINGNGGGISVPSGNSRGGGGGGFLTDGEHTNTCGTGGLESGSSFLNGGVGGLSTSCSTGYPGGFGGGGGSISSGWRASGGGGGYSGGGGGQTNSIATTHRGGGGGSFNSGLNQVNSVALTTGHGRVIITRLCNIVIGTNTGSNLLCQGSALTLTTNAISNYTWSTGSNAASILVSPGVTTTYSLTAMSPSNCMTNAAITITVSAAAPVLTITPSSPTVCLGNTVSISAAGALTYSFSGGISNGVAFTPNATTSYTISGQNGCGISTSVTTISIAPLPVLGISSPTLVCAGNTATLSGGGATTYTWMPGNIVGSSVLVSPQATTIYTVTGSTGNCIGINTVNLATNPNPTVTVSSTHFSICAGESATLTATGAIGYTWTPGGTGSSIVVSPIIPTGYNVVGVNSFGCYANANIPVIAYAGPNMNIAASTTLVCTGGSVSLNASGATTYSWSTGATTPVTVINPVSSAVYTVVGSTPNSPCATTKTVQVDVFTATISVSSPTAICLGESTTLNASGATTYNWSNGSIGNNVTVNPTTSTGYTVNGISTVGGTTCSSTGTTMVTVNPLPTVTASSTRTNICRFEFANLVGGGASTYSWSNGSTASSIAVNPNTNTTYTVVGTDANGCKASASIQIKVFQCVGISETAAASNVLQVYPNPSSGEFNISSSQKMSLILVNELGQLISEFELNAENNYRAEVKDLAKGVYFISSKNSELQLNKKIVVQ